MAGIYVLIRSLIFSALTLIRCFVIDFSTRLRIKTYERRIILFSGGFKSVQEARLPKIKENMEETEACKSETPKRPTAYLPITGTETARSIGKS